MISRILLILSVVYTVSCQTIPAPTDLYKPVTYTNTQYNGVVRVASCSGALIQSWTGSEPPTNTPAYVLSAGHCFADFQMDDKGKVLLDTSCAASATMNDFTNRDQSPTPLNLETFAINKVKFATMNISDIAIIELTVTAHELHKKGYHFYPLSSLTPQGTLLQVGFPMGQAMISADITIQQSVSYMESWGHQIEMAYSYSGAAYYGFSGSSDFAAGNVVNCLTTQMRSATSGFCQRVDYVNPCFSNGIFDFSIPACFGDYKNRMYERFALVLPGYTVPSNATGGTAKFGDGSQVIVREVVKTETTETITSGALQNERALGNIVLLFIGTTVFAAMGFSIQ